MVHAVISKGRFLHVSNEINHQIVPLHSIKKTSDGCEFDSIEDALIEFCVFFPSYFPFFSQINFSISAFLSKGKFCCCG